MADYVGIWDFDEFFIPKGENKNLADLILKAESSTKKLNSKLNGDFSDKLNNTHLWPGGRGWADGNAHPFCFLKLR